MNTPRALLALIVALGGCSADFGGRCATPDDCSEGRICELGYCLDPLSDGGLDRGPDEDASTDGQPPRVDGGGEAKVSCEATPIEAIPAYDDALRACPDQHTIALWRFDDDLLPVGPGFGAGPALQTEPDGDQVALDPSGAVGGAAAFRGGNPQLAFEGAVRAEAPMTVEAWVRTEGHEDQYLVVVSNLRRDIRARADRMGGWELVIDDLGDDGTHQVGLAVTSDDEDRVVERWADDRIAPNTWAHIAVVFDAEETRIHVDGAVTRLPAQTITPRPQRLTLGRRADLPERIYVGRVDELRISSIARPEAELVRVAQDAARPE